MNQKPLFAIATTTLITLGLLSACGGKTKLEACKFVEIEDAEVEVEFGDIDIERGEVEMVCGDKIVDVGWGQFKKQLKIDPGKFKDNPNQFSQQITCYRNESSKKKELLCKGPKTADELLTLNFSFDD